jgi:hypothetical protein
LLPVFAGRPINVVVRKSLGPHHAATSIPQRRILLDSDVLAERGEFERILIHELFHFVWVRLSNDRRREWERLLAKELAGKHPGELGWSAESRKERLASQDIRSRTIRWRQYCCESFCDTAAWMYSGLIRHEEFTLWAKARRLRQLWFQRQFPAGVPVML